MTWNCVTGEKIRIRVILWGDRCHVCEKSACLTLRRLHLPSAVSAMKPFVKKKKPLRGPHQLHSEIMFPLTNTGVLGAFPAHVTCRFVLDPPSCITYCPPPFQAEGAQRMCEDERWLRSGMVSSFCSPSTLLMYASGEPHELSNYWITARSEVVTSKTEGDSPSPFVSPLGVRRTFFHWDLWERGKGCAR